MRLVHLACPQCGAKLQLSHPNMEWVTCQYCSSTFYVQRDRAQAPPMGHPTVYYPPPTSSAAPIIAVIVGIVVLSTIASVVGIVASGASSTPSKTTSSSKFNFALASSEWLSPGPPLLTDVNGDGVVDAIMAASNSGVLAAYHGTTGQKLWTSDDVGRASTKKMALFEDRVLVESDRDLYGIDAKTGKQAWMTPLDAKVKAYCALGPGHIQVSLDDNETLRIDLATGKLTAEARRSLDDRFTSRTHGRGGYTRRTEVDNPCLPIWTNDTRDQEPRRLPEMVSTTPGGTHFGAFNPLPKVAGATVEAALLPVDGLEILLGFKNPGKIPIAVGMRGNKEIWQTPISATETRGDGTVEIATLSRGRLLTVRSPKGPWKIVATNAADGKSLWEAEIQGELGPWRSVTTSSQVVFVRHGWTLHAFAFADGRELYKLGR